MFVNFKNLIESVLTENTLQKTEEAEPLVSDDTSKETTDDSKEDETPTEATLAAKPLFELFFDVDKPASDGKASESSDVVFTPKNLTREINEVNVIYQNAYGPGSAPTLDVLTKIFNIWIKCWTRTSASQFFEYSQYLPYIELIDRKSVV